MAEHNYARKEFKILATNLVISKNNTKYWKVFAEEGERDGCSVSQILLFDPEIHLQVNRVKLSKVVQK